MKRILSGIVALLSVAVMVDSATAAPNTITFSGMEWTIKSSGEPVGPGPNRFSADRKNVFVDRQGRLHLRVEPKVTRAKNGKIKARYWDSAEVIGTRSLGYGTYTWVIDSPIRSMDRNAVFGMFTWSMRPEMHNREIDIELSRWGQGNDAPNVHYTVQPYWVAGNSHAFSSSAGASTVHSFTWSPGNVSFASSDPNGASWSFSGSQVPTARDERPRMNLWMFRGKPPVRRQEIVIRSFRFTPLAAPQASMLQNAKQSPANPVGFRDMWAAPRRSGAQR